MVFRDRAQGGELLAPLLERYRTTGPVVLGLARGGVPVAFEVARRLGAALDVMVVRKIGAPFAREYALGAVSEGGGLYINPDAAHELGFCEADVAARAEPELEEVSRRVAVYRRDEGLPDLAGRTVLLVDDGVATGATARAACRAARRRGARWVVLAAPVIAGQSEPELRAEFDDVVAVDFPPDLIAVCVWYRDFPQVSDDEVLASLARARAASDPGPGELWDGEWIEGEDERTDQLAASHRPGEITSPSAAPGPGAAAREARPASPR